MDPSKTQTPLYQDPYSSTQTPQPVHPSHSTIDPSKTQTPLYQDPYSSTQTPQPVHPSHSIDPSKTQTPLYENPYNRIQTPQPPSYDSSTPVSAATSAPYSPDAIVISPSANIYDNDNDAPIPLRTSSQYAPEPVLAQQPHIDSHGSSQYLHAVPLHDLARTSAPVDCPKCNRRGATVCTTKSGNFTHLWGALVCACSCLGCIPYLISGLKDVRHSCSSCGTLLAVWHRSGGGTDVVAHAMK